MNLVRAGLYLLLLFGALVYNGYGAPEHWFADELLWLADAMVRHGQLSPPNFLYPAGLQVYLTFFAMKIAGAFTEVSPDPTWLVYIGRSICGLFFVFSVYFAEKCVAQLLGRRHDIKTIVIVGTSCALIHHAHIATAQAVSFFAITLCYLTFVRVIVKPSAGMYYLAAAACGLAVGSKYSLLYLGTALPLLYIYVFRPTIFHFVRGMMITAAAALAGFLLVNPYVAIDFPRFQQNMMALIIVEAPHFQSAKRGPIIVSWYALSYFKGFFTPPGLFLMSCVIASALGIAVWKRNVSGSNLDAVGIARRNIELMMLLLLTTSCAYFLAQVSVNINQSRYFIPLGIAAALLFCISVEYIRIAIAQYLPGWTKSAWAAKALLAAVVAGFMVFSVINGIAHVSVFPLAAKTTAWNYLAGALTANDRSKMMSLAITGTGPVKTEAIVCRDRCSRLVFDSIPGETVVNTWSEYLNEIFRRIERADPNLIVVESISFYWTIFVPTKDKGDYGMRLHYPNPGPSVWSERFELLGYRSKRFTRTEIDIINKLIGNFYLQTTEGAASDVYVFEK